MKKRSINRHVNDLVESYGQFAQRTATNFANAGAHLKQLHEDVRQLRKRVAELEDRPLPKWCGAYKKNDEYEELSLVVDHGSLWISKTKTATRPGQSSDWQLCTKGYIKA